MEEIHIQDIATVQLLAWQRAFRGILSDQQLDVLKDSDFALNWNLIIQRPERINLVYTDTDHVALGFISYGPPIDRTEHISHEIYGIYVHPDHWGKKIGYQLMRKAIEQLEKVSTYNGALLWVMTKNHRSRRFYEKFGFYETTEVKISQRNGEDLEETKYVYEG